MKFYLENKLIFELNGTKQRVLKHDIFEQGFEEELMRMIEWVITHNYEQTFKKLKDQWQPKLKELGVEMIPTDDDRLAELIFKHPEYKSRSQREKPMPSNVMDRDDLHLKKQK